MLRRLVLSALLCVSAWTAAHLLAEHGAGAARASISGSGLAGASNDANTADQRWIAGRQFTASTEPGWRAQLQPASLATVLRAGVADTAHCRHVSQQSARYAPSRPFVVPLLI